MFFSSQKKHERIVVKLEGLVAFTERAQCVYTLCTYLTVNLKAFVLFYKENHAKSIMIA